MYTPSSILLLVFFFHDPATTEIYTLSLHDALPISRHTGSSRTHPNGRWEAAVVHASALSRTSLRQITSRSPANEKRSEEHTSELQSQSNLVCRLLLEKKKKQQNT